MNQNKYVGHDRDLTADEQAFVNECVYYANDDTVFTYLVVTPDEGPVGIMSTETDDNTINIYFNDERFECVNLKRNLIPEIKELLKPIGW